MRGKALNHLHWILRARITPACAGKRGHAVFHNQNRQDHPRMCGEKPCQAVGRCRVGGSPPHVRGKETEFATVDLAERITPACAGKSSDMLPHTAPPPDHPRMCGEKKTAPSQDGSLSGSPPHMRGKDDVPGSLSRMYGITPACAGKSSMLQIAVRPLLGSPPHVRGKVVCAEVYYSLHRITPACAGKSPAKPGLH